jgi:hypothetical protein
MLSELTASTRRLALVGLAKNTGKTEALGALLRELEGQGRRVGVTSVGRDGEERDVIDSRIEKPRVRLPAGSIVATTDSLLRASGLPYELLQDTGVRTPLGRVLIARLRAAGVIEVAGPSAAAEVRAASDTMLSHGAEQVLIDGAVDRRAASSPDVADGLVISTGAVLGGDISAVVARTVDAVELARLPMLEERAVAPRRVRALAEDGGDTSVLLDAGGENPVRLPPRFVLSGGADQIAEMLDANLAARWLVVPGALPEQFLRDLAHAAHKRQRELTVVVADSTRVFLLNRGPAWYRAHGITLDVLHPIALKALTVNPVAPQSHRFDSGELRTALGRMVTDIPIIDVLDPNHRPDLVPERSS